MKPFSNAKLPPEPALRKLVAAGASRREIASRFRCKLTTVNDRLKALQIEAPLERLDRSQFQSLKPLPRISVPRTTGDITLPAISMYVTARRETGR